MSYYGAGDYYGAGGIFDTIKKGLGTVARGALGFVAGGPVGAATAVLAGRSSSRGGSSFGSAGGGIHIPPINISPGNILPGGAPLFTVGGRRRRRMNMANGKALNRANRRVDGFVRLARKSLKHTGYRVVTKGSGRKRSVSVHESGPGGVTVR